MPQFDFRSAPPKGTFLPVSSFCRSNLMKRHDFPMPDIRHIDSRHKGMDARDRLIVALYAQLKAERETRETLEWAIRNGAVSRDVLEAIAADPVPAVTGEDIAALEKIVAADERRRPPEREMNNPNG
jgi:hypothetical protein